MSNSILVSLAIVVITACSPAGTGDQPPPAPETVTRVYAPGGGGVQMYNEPGTGSRVLPSSVDSVWRTLPQVYEILGIPDTQSDAAQKIFGNPGYRARRIEGERLSTYVDCGAGATAIPNADSYDVTLSLLTRLAPADSGTLATTTVQASGKPRAVTGNPVHCQSKGTLEARVAELIMFVLITGNERQLR